MLSFLQNLVNVAESWWDERRRLLGHLNLCNCPRCLLMHKLLCLMGTSQWEIHAHQSQAWSFEDRLRPSSLMLTANSSTNSMSFKDAWGLNSIVPNEADYLVSCLRVCFTGSASKGHVAAWSSNTAATHIQFIISASRNCILTGSTVYVTRKLTAGGRSSSGPITKNQLLLKFVLFPSNMGAEIEFSDAIHLAYFAPKGRYRICSGYLNSLHSLWCRLSNYYFFLWGVPICWLASCSGEIKAWLRWRHITLRS